MTPPLETARSILREVDAILAMPAAQSVAERALRFKSLAQATQNLADLHQGFEDEHRRLIELVNPLLEVITRRHSPRINHMLREEPGFREARQALVDYIDKAKRK